MKKVNIREFRANLKGYLGAIEEGEEVAVTSRGKTQVVLINSSRVHQDLRGLGKAEPSVHKEDIPEIKEVDNFGHFNPQPK